MRNSESDEPIGKKESSPVFSSDPPENQAERIEAQANTNAASRVIAVMILMLAPGVAGAYLDKWIGTEFLVLLGFALGIGIAIFGLLYVGKIADVAAKKSRELRNSQLSKSEEAGFENDEND